MNGVTIRLVGAGPQPQTTRWSTSPIRIGRNPLNDIVLPFDFVSTWHAMVRFDEKGARFLDLGSTNGSLARGQRIPPGQPLVVEGTESITIGSVTLVLSTGHGQDLADAPEPPPMLTGPRPEQPRRPPPTSGTITEPQQALSGAPADPGGPASATTTEPPPGTVQAPLHPPQPQRPASPRAASGTIGAPEHPLPMAVSGTIGVPAGPSSPSPTALGMTEQVDLTAAHVLVEEIRPLFSAYRESWNQLHAGLMRGIDSLPGPLKIVGAAILEREFPEIAQEGGLRQGWPRVPGRAAENHAQQALAALSTELCPEDPSPKSPEEVDRFLEVLRAVLLANAKALVELQKGQEQFGNEMGVRTIKEYTPLHAAASPERVLAYLLDWRRGGNERLHELVGVYADLMLHQVALINGVMEGVRSLLGRVGPDALETGVSSPWPTRAAALWKRYRELHRQLLDDDKRISEVVFGPEFARAYAQVGGGDDE
jgi:type VI secretion system protein